MRTRPPDLSDTDLADLLLRGWNLRAAHMEYVAVGGGSHHWLVHDDVGKRHWVTVDDLADKGFLGDTPAEAFVALRCAFEIALTLRETGLEFIVAPLRSTRGETVEPLEAHYTVAVYPYLEGTSGKFGAARSADERAQVIDMLVRLHRTTPAVAHLARTWRIGVAARCLLEDALSELDRPWSGGPYSSDARAVVAQHASALRRLLATFDQLVAEVSAAGAEPVITHGEPHAGNFMRVDGRLLLVDWDTVALAPPERDLWMPTTDTADALARYTEQFGRRLNPAALRLYRLRWLIDDISIVVGAFRSAHAQTADTAHAWQALVRSLASTDLG